MFSTHSWIGRDLWNEASTHAHHTYHYTRSSCVPCMCASMHEQRSQTQHGFCESVRTGVRACVREPAYVCVHIFLFLFLISMFCLSFFNIITFYFVSTLIVRHRFSLNSVFAGAIVCAPFFGYRTDTLNIFISLQFNPIGVFMVNSCD